MHRHVLVTGQGRSGTNWLLNILDQSPNTFCRNEPNTVEDGALVPVSPIRLIADPAQGLTGWPNAAETAAMRSGMLDEAIGAHKAFTRPAARRGLTGLLTHQARWRRRLPRPLRTGEWRPSRLVVDPTALREATVVFKINRAAPLAGWLLAHTVTPIVEIVRHPGARHESFLRRYADEVGRDRALHDRCEELMYLASTDDEWARRLGDIDLLTLAEAETWFWRYQTERLAVLGAGHPDRYLRVVYEELLADPLTVSREVYDHLGLAWDDDIASRIEAALGETVWGPRRADVAEMTNGWRSRLDAADCAAIDEILDGSSLADLWRAVPDVRSA